MAEIKYSDHTKCWPGYTKLDHSDIAGGNVKWYSHSGNSLAVSLKTKPASHALEDGFLTTEIPEKSPLKG